MASPTPGTGTFTGVTSNSTTWTATLSSRSALDLLLLTIFQDGSGTPTTPGGWEQLFTGAGGTTPRLTILGRITDAAEGATVAITMPNESGGVYCHTITGHGLSGGAIAANVPKSTVATGTSTAPDATDVTISSSKDWLFLAAYAQDTGAPRATAYPTNYGTGQVTNGAGGSTGASGGLAFRALTTGSNEDPSAFTSNTNVAWAAGIIAIPPVAAAADNPVFRHRMTQLIAH